jgi:iron complex outermembrane receptor protein
MGAALAALLLASTSADAAPSVASVDIHRGPLATAIRELARAQGVDILFQESLLHGGTTAGLKGRFTAQQALTALLSGTDVGYQITPDGVFVLAPRPVRPSQSPDDGAISEVLVIGHRTQNADIRRTENDIQPYTVIGPRELAVAPHNNLDQYFRDRLSSNGQLVSPYQNVRSGAANNSSLDLRGVGSQRTLVLIDGRRLPALPTMAFGFSQADLNAIPLGTIERIETLTATAGGIHGPSAVGGVVNVVLKRDYRGAELVVDAGVTDRGDAAHLRLEGRAGFTPNAGLTNILVAASYATAEPLTVGERDYGLLAKQYRSVNDPKRFYLGGQPIGGVLIGSYFGETLRFAPSLGGASLGSVFTSLPLDLQGEGQALQAALAANAGKARDAPADGLGGRDTSLVSTPRTRAILVNVRHQASERLEAFVDALYLDNRAEARLPRYYLGTLNPSRLSPFTSLVNIIIPLPELAQDWRSDTTSYRVTTGAIVRLPRRWQASADYTLGRAVLETDYRSRDVGPDFLGWGIAGRNGQPMVTPFGGYATMRAGLGAYLVDTSSHLRLTNTLHDATVRAAGPLASLAGGPLTLTLMGEFRREHIPESANAVQGALAKSSTLTYDRAQEARSGYAELRAPLVAGDAGFLLARGLELQIAMRHDDVRTTVPENRAVVAQAASPFTARHRADVYTVGARVLPAPWLMLRASLATGQTPPALQYLQQRTLPISSGLIDPQRGGRKVIADGAAVEIRDGSRKIGQEKGRTLSAGAVLNPTGTGPRLSIDVSRAAISDEIVRFAGGADLLSRDSLYPERVVREPLSLADAARGYTAGRVTGIYTGYGNDGRTTVETVDYQFDWTLPSTVYGQGRVYGAATWEPVLKSKVKKGGPWLRRAGLRDAPPRWRGNAGLAWTRGALIVDLNVQYVSSSETAWSPVYPVLGDIALAQGSSHIPAQGYVDLTARRHFTSPAGSSVRAFDVRVGVQNLFDTSPPIVADVAQMGYDYHGDPRRRRVEVLLAASF